MDEATSAQIALERQLENLEVQLSFLQRVHKEVTHSCLVVGMSFIFPISGLTGCKFAGYCQIQLVLMDRVSKTINIAVIYLV